MAMSRDTKALCNYVYLYKKFPPSPCLGILKPISRLHPLFNRPNEAGAVLQTPLLLINYMIHPFPPNLQNIINPKPSELGN